MTTNYEVGSVLTGKVAGIQPYGAFIALDEETQGLVHISEIKHGYVKDINEHLKIGDEVKVKVLTVDEESGKISLSIRATEEAPKQEKKPARRRQANVISEEPTEGFNTLKDKLQEWINQSDLIKK
ncbi:MULTISPECIES: S1 domain-containing post-transcriptional regulator GSP13 [Heyndrickxia]|jgi:general stress protein 13|uniref:RNA-binding protein S1 n=1 Tax=Heyndrickxia oleronia TaxID=38875 RepID=A0A8E2I3M1_9BACI|nr:S1 domain-containing post-transcriptional regulator GSP13 [Heyndrickxia oleronia]NYV68577.1 general stress protein 13 [Bacillus sp. Gen3]OJH18169.1 RNA-binding protein S1 [Bacillus obstructivus]MBU5215036.1 general stress protein 13 [Heyndrickxia oleronia]MCI1591248.1 S1 domain-containing post-transcriptional regulator GSP13 [Heyndrickxia oleronia]MCI1615663.1 S1 domain-containing post-transcriptional regulator GSP13 [Heyndrickxia oleronia]